MAFDAPQNTSRYVHLTLNGWVFGTYVDSIGVTHEIERPSDVVQTHYFYIDKFGCRMRETEIFADFDLINKLQDKFGSGPNNAFIP